MFGLIVGTWALFVGAVVVVLLAGIVIALVRGS